MGYLIYRNCYKCGRTGGFESFGPDDLGPEDKWLETKQIGCYRCNKNAWPKYRADYNSGSDVWVIFKQYYKPLKSWFGFGPIKEYLVEEVLRLSYNSHGPEMEFDTFKEAKDAIKALEERDKQRKKLDNK